MSSAPASNTLSHEAVRRARAEHQHRPAWSLPGGVGDQLDHPVRAVVAGDQQQVGAAPLERTASISPGSSSVPTTLTSSTGTDGITCSPVHRRVEDDQYSDPEPSRTAAERLVDLDRLHAQQQRLQRDQRRPRLGRTGLASRGQEDVPFLIAKSMSQACCSVTCTTTFCVADALPVAVLESVGTSSTLMSWAIAFSTGRAWPPLLIGAPLFPIGITSKPPRMSTWSPAWRKGVSPCAESSGIAIARWSPVRLYDTASVGAVLKSLGQLLVGEDVVRGDQPADAGGVGDSAAQHLRLGLLDGAEPLLRCDHIAARVLRDQPVGDQHRAVVTNCC